jgi:hypothetical protein
MKKKMRRVEKPLFNSAGHQINLKDLNGDSLPNPGRVSFQPFNHGGARIGAGRKPSGRKAVLLRLSPRLISELRKEAARSRKTLSDVAEDRLAHA